MSAHHDSSAQLSEARASSRPGQGQVSVPKARGARSGTAAVYGARPVSRIGGMLFAPKEEWALIQSEATSQVWLYATFVLPLAILAACVAFIHVSVIGTNESLGSTVRASLRGGLTTAILVIVFGLLGIWIMAYSIDAFASFFGGVRNRRMGAAVAAYSSTPIWIATVFVLFPNAWPSVYVLAVAWHTYLLYLGLHVLMKAPRDRVLGFATTVVLCSILLEIVFTMVSVALGGATHMNPYRAFG
jgi:hypothetical protein